MRIAYKSKKLKRICEEYDTATKAHGAVMAKKIHQRIDELKAVDSIETLVKSRIGRCHSLTGKRNGQYAMDLTGSYRLVFEEQEGQVIAVQILEIIDYH